MLLLSLLLSGCLDDCNRTSREAEYVRSLSDNDFASIYEAAVNLYPGKHRHDYEGDMPPELAKHGVLFVRVIQPLKPELFLRLAGCGGSWVDIVVLEDDENPKIQLKYGRNSREIMWEKNDV